MCQQCGGLLLPLAYSRGGWGPLFHDKNDCSLAVRRSFIRKEKKVSVNRAAVRGIIKSYKARKAALIAILQDIQERHNWLPPEAMRMVADGLNVSLVDVYCVATFYKAFSLTPRGKHLVTVCLGTACHVRGAQTVLDHIQNRLGISAGSTTKDKQYTLETVNCLGACALAPVVVVDGQYHGQTTIQKVEAILGRKKGAKGRSQPSRGMRRKK
jgi:NADH-quinone oxidoreductase subunit E